MRTSRLRPFLNVVAINYNVKRAASVNSRTVDANSNQSLKTWKDIPGPSSLPIIGQLRHYLPGGSLYGIMGSELQNHLFKQYGPVVKLEGLLGMPDAVFIYDAESAGQILRGEDSMPKRPAFPSLKYYRKVYSKKKGDPIDIPTGLTTDNDQAWRKFRTTMNPLMLKPKTIKLYANTLDEVALDTVASDFKHTNCPSYAMKRFALKISSCGHHGNV